MRRVGVLMCLAADHPHAPARVAARAPGLQQLSLTNNPVWPAREDSKNMA
jgi:hypothetical protein